MLTTGTQLQRLSQLSLDNAHLTSRNTLLVSGCCFNVGRQSGMISQKNCPDGVPRWSRADDSDLDRDLSRDYSLQGLPWRPELYTAARLVVIDSKYDTHRLA